MNGAGVVYSGVFLLLLRAVDANALFALELYLDKATSKREA